MIYSVYEKEKYRGKGERWWLVYETGNKENALSEVKTRRLNSDVLVKVVELPGDTKTKTFKRKENK